MTFRITRIWWLQNFGLYKDESFLCSSVGAGSTRTRTRPQGATQCESTEPPAVKPNLRSATIAIMSAVTVAASNIEEGVERLAQRRRADRSSPFSSEHSPSSS